MKMKILAKGFIAALCTGVALMSATMTTAFAATDGSNSDIKSYVQNGNAAGDGRFTAANNFNGSSDGYSVYYDSNGVGYYIKTSDESGVVNSIKKSGNQASVQNVEDKLSEVQNDLGLQADTNKAGVALSGFGGLLSTILGFLVILIGGRTTKAESCNHVRIADVFANPSNIRCVVESGVDDLYGIALTNLALIPLVEHQFGVVEVVSVCSFATITVHSVTFIERCSFYLKSLAVCEVIHAS